MGSACASGGSGDVPQLTPDQEDFLKKGDTGKPERAQTIEKMKQTLGPELTPAAILAFLQAYDECVKGESGMIAESSIVPASDVMDYESLKTADKAALKDIIDKTVVLKLNGGLGTGMGLEKAKSLLEVVDGNNFLDFTAQQLEHQRKEFNSEKLGFLLMNSFSTDEDTHDALKKYAHLGKWEDIRMMQNIVPKITQDTFAPAAYPENTSDEWCPPGHGDLWAAITGSGKLQQLLDDGKDIVFVSNSDNLGATLDLNLLQHFSSNQDFGFMMEVCQRTEADKKGGHLAKLKEGGLILREKAQCAEEDEKAFEDIKVHQYFNTNNLWFKLSAVKKIMAENNGVMKLPMIRNDKTVNPRDKKSTKVYQLETAMGAAIANFGPQATAVKVPRSRFAPVKKCDDLLNLRSDAYVVKEDKTLQLADSRSGVPPTVSLGDTFKKIAEFDHLVKNGIPSMLECDSLKILPKDAKKILSFEKGVIFKGKVTITVDDTADFGDAGPVLKAGTYTGDVKVPPS